MLFLEIIHFRKDAYLIKKLLLMVLIEKFEYKNDQLTLKQLLNQIFRCSNFEVYETKLKKKKYSYFLYQLYFYFLFSFIILKMKCEYLNNLFLFTEILIEPII